MQLELLGNTLELWQIILVFGFVVPYGLAFGIRNTVLKVISLLPTASFKQNDIGKIGDALMISSLILLALTVK